MIEDAGTRAVRRQLDRMVASGDDLPDDLTIARGDDRVTISGPGVRLRALTDARIAGFARSVAVRR